MVTPIGNMVVHLGLDQSGFENKLKKVTGSLKSFQSDIKGMERRLTTSKALSRYAITGGEAFKAYGEKVNVLNGLITRHAQYQSKLSGDYSRITNLTKGLSQDMDILNQKRKESIDLYGKDSVQAQAYADKIERVQLAMKEGTKQQQFLAQEYETSTQKLAQYRYELGEAVKTQYSQYSLAGRVGKGLTTIGNGLSTISQKTRGMSVALGAGFTYATKAAMDFEDGMTTIRALIADTTPAEKMDGTMRQLSDSVKSYAKSYGISTSDIIAGMQEMIRRGYDANQTMEAMPHILAASKASGEDFGVVMHATTAILEQYNLKAEDTQRVTDSLTFVANKTAADFASLGLAMEYVGPVAATAGISLEETASAIGLLSQRGIEGEKAGTNLRNTILAMTKPTKSQAEAWDAMGVSIDEVLAGHLGLADVLDIVRNNTNNLTDAQKGALYAQAVGKTGVAGFNALVAQGGDALRNLTKETENAKDSTKEMADVMMSSSKNKLAKVKGEFEVLAIELGEELLPILLDVAKGVQKGIEWFKQLSPEVKNLVINFGLAAAAISPFTGVLGAVFKVIGGGISGVTSLYGAFKKYQALKNVTSIISGASGAVTAIGGAAGGATGAVGGLAGAIGLLGNPITWGVIAGGAVLGAVGYFAFQAQEAKQRTEEWGAAVSKTQANELQQFKNKVDETNQAMIVFGADGASQVENVRQAFQKLVDDITALMDKDLAKKLKLAEKWGLSDEQKQRMIDNAQETKNTIQGMSDDVVKIYQNAADNHRDITENERAIVRSAQNAMIEEKLHLLGYEKDESVAIRKAMNGEIDELNETQVKKGLDTVKKWIKEENKSYKQAKDEFKKLYESKGLTQAEYNQKMEELEANHNAVMEAYGEQYIALQKKLSETGLKHSTPEAQKAILSQIQSTMEALGVSYEQFQAKMEETASTASKTSSLVATYWAGMSEEARTAVDYWNSIVLDPVTGEVKTNAQEEIQKALQAEGGWESMKLSIKEGKLTTTATMAIGQALIASGQWETLSLDDKKLVIDHSPAMKAITESEASLQAWKELPDVTKHLLANNTDFLNNTDVAKTVLDNWNALTPDEKVLVAKNLTSEDVTLAQNTIDQLSGKTVDLNANDNTSQPTLDAYVKVNGVAQVAPAQVFAADNTASGTASAQDKIDKTQQRSPASLAAQDNTAAGTSQAQSAIDRTQQRTPIAIRASDQASSTVRSIVSGFPLVHTIKVVAQAAGGLVGKIFGHENGTDFHPGGLAMVNDQKNAVYKELVTLPNGYSFVPKGRNVVLPLPRGSKVLKASKTKSLLEKSGVFRYADGVGYASTSPMFRAMDAVESRLQQTSTQVVTVDNGAVLLALQEIAQLLRESGKQSQVPAVYLDGDLLTRKVTQRQERRLRIDKVMKGVMI